MLQPIIWPKRKPTHWFHDFTVSSDRNEITKDIGTVERHNFPLPKTSSSHLSGGLPKISSSNPGVSGATVDGQNFQNLRKRLAWHPRPQLSMWVNHREEGEQGPGGPSKPEPSHCFKEISNDESKKTFFFWFRQTETLGSLFFSPRAVLGWRNEVEA